MADDVLTKLALERGLDLIPAFDERGLIAAIVQDHVSKDVLMMAWMNKDSLELTLKTGIAHYWSRSRGELWKKGETSGQLQTVKEISVDCDQDALLLKVEVGGDGGCCHVGFKSCFYRSVTDEEGHLTQTQAEPDSP
jgi:phosphoribosyl-AMP cyclohydrolase